MVGLEPPISSGASHILRIKNTPFLEMRAGCALLPGGAILENEDVAFQVVPGPDAVDR